MMQEEASTASSTSWLLANSRTRTLPSQGSVVRLTSRLPLSAWAAATPGTLVVTLTACRRAPAPCSWRMEEFVRMHEAGDGCTA